MTTDPTLPADGLYVERMNIAFDLRWFDDYNAFRRRFLDSNRFGEPYTAQEVQAKLAAKHWAPAFVSRLENGTYAFEADTAFDPAEPDEPKTLGEQLHDEHNRTVHADGSRCLCDPTTTVLADLTERVGLPHEMAPSEWPTPRAMAEIACRKRTIGQGFQSGFEEGVTAERARFEAAPLVSLADYAKPRT